jgi:thymidylate synthase (FAD)
MIRSQTDTAMEIYHILLGKGVAPEVARSVLPQSMYTEFVETGSLAAYARLCHLRLGPDAQKEIREYATRLSQLLEPVFPVSWKALQATF